MHRYTYCSQHSVTYEVENKDGDDVDTSTSDRDNKSSVVRDKWVMVQVERGKHRHPVEQYTDDHTNSTQALQPILHVLHF